ncbi:MAG: MATE family efflux transporter [Oscillospiraceae bacterium]|nr:MATE family efflux transporter [Oscillospiraceae bacterium]
MHILSKLIEPKHPIELSRQRFSNDRLIRLIVPILIEQLLVMLVGMADTLMVSYAGEAAVSGVSLVNQLNNVFIFIFGSVASGGAVVASQYVGRNDRESGVTAASQLVMITTLIAIFMTAVSILFRKPMLNTLFGKVEQDVMDASLTYLVITAASFPALGIYNCACAIFRSMNGTRTIMNVSVIMNIINVGGNAIGIFALRAGVAGVAYPSLISRIVAAAIMLILAFNKDNTLYLQFKRIFSWNGKMLGRILKIAIPGGIENGLFQVSKVALSGIVALFGTVQIAANGVAQSFWALAALIPIAFGYAFVTVIGQCMGAGDPEAADYYSRKLLRITYTASAAWSILMLAVTPVALIFYNLSYEAKQLVFLLSLIHNVFNVAFSPVAFSLSDGMRAAGDVKYTMLSAIFATVVCRVFFSVLLGIWLDMGVIGICIAMVCDWLIKGILIFFRWRSKKWLSFHVI